MLLVKSYREKVFAKYQINQLATEYDETSYLNHISLLSHIFNNYTNTLPLYIAQTANPDYTQPSACAKTPQIVNNQNDNK
jgi:hypothetical protein